MGKIIDRIRARESGAGRALDMQFVNERRICISTGVTAATVRATANPAPAVVPLTRADVEELLQAFEMRLHRSLKQRGL